MRAKHSNYRQTRSSCLWMIRYYSRDLHDDPRCAQVSDDEFEEMYQFDQKMVAHFSGTLLLLEAKKLLEIID